MKKPTMNIRLHPATVKLLNKVRGPLTQNFFIEALIKKFIKDGHNVSDFLSDLDLEEDN